MARRFGCATLDLKIEKIRSGVPFMKRVSRTGYLLLQSAAMFCFLTGLSSAQEATPTVPSGQATGSIAAPSVPQSSGPISAVPGPMMSPLAAGDLIDYSVYGVPEMTQRTRINSEGHVYLPLLNDVELGGLTTEQAQKKLEDLLVNGGFLRNPHVTVAVIEYANGISLLGEVNRPGVYPVSGPRRLYDLLASSGGLGPNAGNQVTITRAGQPEKPEIISISRDPSKVPDGNVLVSPGDTVVVSKAGIIYVVGEVVQPSGFLLDGEQTFTVLKAIAMAHGLSTGAKRDGTKVIRREGKGFVEIAVPLSKIMSAKANDVELKPDDIVFVPTNVAKAAARRTMDTAISLITGVTIVHATR